jgi:protein TonB
MNVRHLDTPLIRFFCASVTLHSLVFSLFYLGGKIAIPAREDTISVSLLAAPPAPEKKLSEATRIPRAPATRSIKGSTLIAKKESAATPEKSAPASEKTLTHEISRDERRPPEPPKAPEPIQENTIVAERPLPSVKDLLPPPNWSSLGSRSSAPVNLNTRDPVYVTYFNKIKQLIESQWEYPEMALRYGLQGRLALEFTISGNGRLEQIRLIRSSGSQLLDEEAVRAVRAAAPFPPIPPWIKPNPLLISASMEYHDNRLNYRFSR